MHRRFLFTSAPLHGHLDLGGYLKTATHLVDAGHKVLWVSEEPIRSTVEARTVPFRAVNASGWRWPSTSPSGDLLQVDRYRRALDVSLTESAVAQATGDLLQVVEDFNPDVIIGEPFIAAAALASEKAYLPYIVCGYPATPRAEHEFVDAEREVAAEGRARLTRLFKHFGVSGRNWPHGLSPWPQSPKLHVVYFSDEWYSDLNTVESQTRFVGGVAEAARGPAPQWFKRIPAEVPLAFITLGSIFTDDADFFVITAHACVKAGVFPIISLGRSPRAPRLKQKLASRLPRCLVTSWVDYAHLFPLLSVVIHHGGMGTTHAAVTYAVPQVIVPHAADQSLQARRAMARGVGVVLAPREATRAAMQHALENVTHDTAFREKAQILATTFAIAGGVPQAAQWIECMLDDAL